MRALLALLPALLLLAAPTRVQGESVV